MASEGDPHQLNGVFEDPPADLEILIPGFFGTTVNRRDIPIRYWRDWGVGVVWCGVV